MALVMIASIGAGTASAAPGELEYYKTFRGIYAIDDCKKEGMEGKRRKLWFRYECQPVAKEVRELWVEWTGKP